MKSRKVRFLFLLLAVAFVLSWLTPYGTQQANLPPDPEGESQVAYTLQQVGGNPMNGTSSAYVLDDESIVVNFEAQGTADQIRTYRVDVDLDTNTYAITLQNSGSIAGPFDVWSSSVAVVTYNKDTGRNQVKTTNQLAYRVANGTVGFTCYGDKYEVFPTSVTGGLTWSIVNSPVNPPYSAGPYLGAILINDTGNGKYKNFNYGDPNLSTVAVHFIRIEKWASDPDNIFRYSGSHKMKNEGKRRFSYDVRVNQDRLPNPVCI